MTSFTNGVELIDPRCLLGKHEKAAPAIGCRPFAFLHIGTICLEVRIRSAALIFLARHKTAILGATLLAGVVRQLRGTGCQPVHSRIVAVGWQVPTCGVGVDRSSSVLEKSWRTRRPAPRTMPGAAATGPDGNCNSTPGNIFFYQLCRLLSHLGTSCPKVGLSFRMAQRGPFPFPLQRGTVYNFLES